MREIKFRAITREGKIIKNVGKIEFFEDGSIIVNDEIPVEKLIQYTGLKDKERKEIWEGDILEYDGEKIECKKCGHKQLYYSSHKLYEIKWNQEMCEFVCENDENSMNPCIWGKDMKIIGNIYENPELLEEK